MMDRTAKLAAEARDCLEFEKFGGYSQEAMRSATREVLSTIAASLGFSHLEISAAVDEALTAAGTTP
jgi:hypothetical protein